MVVSIKSNGTWTEVPALKGTDGAAGSQGPAGANGTDGYSPVVTITQITGGHRISITDSTHIETPLTFDVMDGTNGTTPVKGTDYWTAADQSSIVQDVLNALPAAESVSV